MNLTDIISNGRAPSENYMNGNDNIVIDKPDQQSALDQDSGLKELGTIKRFYSVYDVYYGLLHFIQPSVITKCGFIPEKRS